MDVPPRAVVGATHWNTGTSLPNYIHTYTQVHKDGHIFTVQYLQDIFQTSHYGYSAAPMSPFFWIFLWNVCKWQCFRDCVGKHGCVRAKKKRREIGGMCNTLNVKCMNVQERVVGTAACTVCTVALYGWGRMVVCLQSKHSRCVCWESCWLFARDSLQLQHTHARTTHTHCLFVWVWVERN